MNALSHASLVPAVTLDEAYARSGAERWGVTPACVSEAVGRAVRARFGDGTADSGAVHAFVDTLHLADLGLACACAEGIGSAWDHFVLTFRPELYRAARAIAGDAASRELADSLYADLFGLTEAEGTRRSLFRYYHGRSKLTTWLRSVLAQRHVDMVRAGRRLTSLDDPEHPADTRLPAASAPPQERVAGMQAAAAAISEALTALEPQDRLRLAYYYVHDLTLAETGRLFAEHEATASRKLERARKALRTGIEAALEQRGLSTADIDDWVAVSRHAWDAALGEALGVPAPSGSSAVDDATQGGAAPPFRGKRTP